MFIKVESVKECDATRRHRCFVVGLIKNYYINNASNISINFIPIKNAEINLLGKYAGRQFLDNTSQKSRSLNAYYVQDVRAIYNIKNVLFKELNFILQVNNVFNKKYEPNGYTYPYFYEGSLVNDNYYYPMAGTNFMLSVNVRL